MSKKRPIWYVTLKPCWHSAELRWVGVGETVNWSHLNPAMRQQHELWGTARPATDDEINAITGESADLPIEEGE